MLGCIIKREVPMPNTIFSQDKPGSLQLRNDTRPQHRVMDADGREVAARFAEAGPYFLVGLRQSVRMCRWKQTIRDGKRIAT